jgi:adenylate cyclase class 2
MLEIEQKFRVPDHAAVRRALDRLGAVEHPAHTEVDHYLNAPDRDFAATGEAFRLRRVGDDNRFTYKGPKRPGVVKTRPEIELTVAGGEAGAGTAMALLAGLGYRPVAVVRKTRTVWTVTPTVAVCLDAVEAVGTFVEVEALADEEQAKQAEADVRRVAVALGLTDAEPRSYLRMLLEAGG